MVVYYFTVTCHGQKTQIWDLAASISGEEVEGGGTDLQKPGAPDPKVTPDPQVTPLGLWRRKLWRRQ